jgi:hypothetical protein
VDAQRLIIGVRWIRHRALLINGTFERWPDMTRGEIMYVVGTQGNYEICSRLTVYEEVQSNG